MTFTWNKAKRRCGKCSTDVPNAVKGWSMHPVYRMVCPACTAARQQAKRTTHQIHGHAR